MINKSSPAALNRKQFAFSLKSNEPSDSPWSLWIDGEPIRIFCGIKKNAYRVEHFLLWISHFLTKWFRLEIDIQFRLPEKYHVLVFRRVVARKRPVYCVRKRPIYTSPRSWNKQYKISTKTISTVVLYNISGKTSLKIKTLCTSCTEFNNGKFIWCPNIMIN